MRFESTNTFPIELRLRFLEEDEEGRLLDASGEPLRSIILLGIHTGLRIQAEALTLNWASVDLRRASITVEAAYAKNGRTRTVPLNSTVFEVLKRLKEISTSEFVFPYQSIGTSFGRASRRANLTGVTPHTLRHTFASRLVMAGVDLRTVQELGGWQTLAMVERYAHLSPAHKAQAVERIAIQKAPELQLLVPMAPVTRLLRVPTISNLNTPRMRHEHFSSMLT